MLRPDPRDVFLYVGLSLLGAGCGLVFNVGTALMLIGSILFLIGAWSSMR